MLEVSILCHIFHFRVRNPAVMLEEWWQPSTGDVATLIDGGCQNRATVLAVPDWIVGATTEK